jgi:hypothetical protein
VSTLNEKEKLRYVKFDRLGHHLITGIANLTPALPRGGGLPPDRRPAGGGGPPHDPPALGGGGDGPPGRGGGGGGGHDGEGGEEDGGEADENSRRMSAFAYRWEKRNFFSSMYYIQHCFICRPSDSTVSEDAGTEPRTVGTSALAVRRSNH